jgi:hypothetical protein
LRRGLITHDDLDAFGGQALAAEDLPRQGRMQLEQYRGRQAGIGGGRGTGAGGLNEPDDAGGEYQREGDLEQAHGKIIPVSP